MALPNTSEKSVALDREENVTKSTLSAKRVALYYYDSNSDTLIPINSNNPVPVTGTVTATPTGTQDVQGNVAAGATDSGNPVKTGGKYNTTAPTLTNGQRGDTQLDLNANTKVVEGAVEISSPFNTVGTATAVSIKAAAGYLQSIAVSNVNTALRYLQIHNKASAPSVGETAAFSFPIPAGTATSPGYAELNSQFFQIGGYYCATGIAIGISTTATTYTAATAADHVIGGMFI